MAVGLAALLDDIAAIAKTAAASLDDIAGAASKASTKAIGVVVDDTAVTPQYVQGLNPARELPVIGRIAKGSLINKLLIIVAVLAINYWAAWLLTPLLMLGGTYLCFEGAEKVIEWLLGQRAHKETPAVDQDAQTSATASATHTTAAEDQLAKGAIRTDFILSAEIMVIALNEIKDQSFGLLVAAMIATALLITALVYGSVAVLVKMDDFGIRMMHGASKQTDFKYRFGFGLVQAMPKVMACISVVGTLAMMWVGGHLVVQGFADLGFSPILDFIHYLAHSPAAVPGIGGFLSWLTDTIGSMICGFIWGSLFAIPVLAAHRRQH
ncbi:DUF808 domain-containing protein [Arcanobacterium hippocoleae]|uniref:DNA repair protein MutK n=1 Tax=Arcanobacterium hippocoleae TaxID=149017 RepID=A0ABU1T2C3_9ACTO|nr:DUF808 domain-containing protein [Arcanobacterium hippocoleae]MDR6939537.1 putative DNA repair protein MutK [Arcanobacterium hippocoleae]